MPPFNATVVTAVFAVGTATAALWSFRHRGSHKFAIPLELKDSPYFHELKLAVSLALKAGGNMAGYLQAKGTSAESSHDLGIETKGKPEDICTKIDFENEALIMEAIHKSFPDHKVIGEESTGTGAIARLTQDKTWVIDPVDGTTNFASGLVGLTCVSIGLCDGGKPVMGAVFVPGTQELYLAVQGHGAFRNGVRLSPRSSTTLANAMVGFEFGYAREKDEITKMVSAVQKVMEHGCRGTRQFGSGVLDLLWVASGRMDVVYAGVASEGWKPWDYAAGMVIAKETGCVIEAIHQEPEQDFDLYSDSVICATSQELLEECRKVIT